jgi:GNAT superfamily N-acetyltransferase
MEEGDMPTYRDICWAAFKDDLMGLMYPNGYTEAAREWWQKQAIEDWREHPEKIKFMKVIDTELPEDDPNKRIVGIANWKLYPHDRSEEELEEERKQSEERGFPPDCNQALLEDFFGKIAEYKRKILGGRAHVFLNMLATHPSHHRRGIGAIHMRWGNEQADRLGLPCYLEASPMGKPLYLREGYEVICDFPFDGRDWGSTKELPHVCMLRPAKHTNGQAS